MQLKLSSFQILLGFVLILFCLVQQQCRPASSNLTEISPSGSSPIILSAIDSLLFDSVTALVRGENPKLDLDTFIRNLKSSLPENHPVLAYSIYQRGVLEYRASNYGGAGQYYADAVRRYESNHATADVNTICKLYRNISTSFYLVGESLDSAYYYADLGLQKMNKYPDSLVQDKIRIGLYQWAGNAARELGNLAGAADLHKMGVDLCQQGRGDYKVCGSTAMHYAWTLSNQSILDSALHYSILAEDIMLAYKETFSAWDYGCLGDIYNDRFEIFSIPEHAQKALQTLRKSLEINQKNNPNSGKVANNYNNLGYVYTHLQKPDSASYYLQQSMAINELREDHFRLAQNLENMADIAIYADKNELALRYLNQACAYYFPNPKKLPITTALYKFEMILPMRQRAQTLLSLHQEDSMRYPLRMVLTAYEQVDSMVSALQFSVRSEKSKLHAIEKLKTIYEDLIGICQSSWQSDKNPQYLAKAFQYLERSKALVLRERRQRAQLTVSKHPNAYQKRERQLIGDISRLNLKLQRESLTKSESSHLLNDLHRLELTLKAYRDSIYQYTTKYESYLSDSDSGLKISEKIQASLSPDQVVIDYFIGDRDVFAGTISPNGFNIHKLPVSAKELTTRVNLFRSLTDASGNPFELMKITPAEKQQLDSAYLANAYWLYQKLLEPLSIPKSTTHLTVIPDGALAFLPFSALLTEEEEIAESYQSYSYLIKEKVINHQFSLAVWYDNLQRTHTIPTKRILAIAPSQSESKTLVFPWNGSDYFSSLRYNQEETRHLKKKYGAILLTDTKATRKNFEQIAGDFSVIHFAGHAYADSDHPYHAFLAFDTDHASDFEDELLLLDQLEKLPLQAELVVLSACQTADGDLAKGEGVISLSRAVTLAGARSVISCLWLMNQESKVGLFQNFYDHLANGMSKDEALRLAQLDYIQGQEAHPYHWAGTTNTGNSGIISLFSDSF